LFDFHPKRDLTISEHYDEAVTSRESLEIMKSSSQKDVISRTGNLMLKGWKLLSVCCPLCHAPLLSKDNEMRCPGCDLPVRKESGEQSSTANHHNNVSHADPLNSSESEVVDDIVDVPKSYEELRREYDERKKQSNDVSGKLGEKMLQGWVLLADSCPDMNVCGGVPLMKDPSTGSMVCLSCGKEYVYDPLSQGNLIEKGKKSTVSASNEQQKASITEMKKETNDKWKEIDEEFETLIKEDDKDPPRLFNFTRHDNDSSWKISQKLLQGWSLIDQSCQSQNCNGKTPLMKDHKGKVSRGFQLFQVNFHSSFIEILC
jgi:uncharacterized Zn finger protein (UPF0148 family)